ncbi:hypothetical protein CRENBAI_000895, partial [Crenichthys baileyi]
MSKDRIEVLRERNKYLLKQLRQQREKLERMSGCSLSRKRGREDEGVDEKEERRHPEVMGDLSPARAALAQPSFRFTDTEEMHKGPSSNSSSHSGTSRRRVPAVPTTLTDGHRNPQDYYTPADPRPLSVQSSRVMDSKLQVQSQVGFQSDEFENKPASDRHHVQPLLGYDWIAGVLDTEDSLAERSDEFFNDLRMFRSINKDECIHPGPAESFEENHLFPPLLTDEDDRAANTDTHQCTFSYRINSRLFPVPLHSQECCPVCKKHKSSHPHTAVEPALISIRSYLSILVSLSILGSTYTTLSSSPSFLFREAFIDP